MTTTARVVVLQQYGVLQLNEVELPDPGQGQVLVEVRAATISADQLHRVQTAGADIELMGGEAAATVMAVGPGVTGVEPGDNVLVLPQARPGAGRAPTPAVVELEDGSMTAPGTLYSWATNAVLDQRYLLKIPRQPDREATSILGGTVLAGAGPLLRLGRDRVEGKRVAVLGVSGTGLAAVAAAKALGAAAITAVDRSDKRLALATQLGASATLNAPADRATETLKAGGGVDVLLDSVYEYKTKNRPGSAALAPGGTAIALGLAGMEGERDALGRLEAAGYVAGHGSPDPDGEIATLLEWIEDGRLNPGTLVTLRYTIEQANEGIRDLESGDLVGAAIMVIEPLR